MKIQENTLAEACYNENTIEELELAMSQGADPYDMEAWGLTENEWIGQIGIAIAAMKEDAVTKC